MGTTLKWCHILEAPMLGIPTGGTLYQRRYLYADLLAGRIADRDHLYTVCIVPVFHSGVQLCFANSEELQFDTKKKPFIYRMMERSEKIPRHQL